MRVTRKSVIPEVSGGQIIGGRKTCLLYRRFPPRFSLKFPVLLLIMNIEIGRKLLWLSSEELSAFSHAPKVVSDPFGSDTCLETSVKEINH